MAKIKIYKDSKLQQIVIFGISKEFPNNYRIAYTPNTVTVENLADFRTDLVESWQNITDDDNREFVSFAELKSYLNDLFIPISLSDLGEGESGANSSIATILINGNPFRLIKHPSNAVPENSKILEVNDSVSNGYYDSTTYIRSMVYKTIGNLNDLNNWNYIFTTKDLELN